MTKGKKLLHDKLTEVIDILIDNEDTDLNYEEFARMFKKGDSNDQVHWTIKITKRRRRIK